MSMLKRDVKLIANVDRETKAAIEELARADARTVSRYIEQVIRRHVESLTPRKKQPRARVV